MAVLLTSCDKAATAGLKELVEKCRSHVVASADGVESLKESLPTRNHADQGEELPEKAWFPVMSIPLRGLGFAPAAYEFTWAGKNVLFSGRIPLVVTQETGQSLIRDLTSSGGDTANTPRHCPSFATESRISGCLRSRNDQNANLYERNWVTIIEDNLMVTNFILSSGR